jgi:HAE1 family hydrophobic/amphiphilic exporter-1
MAVFAVASLAAAALRCRRSFGGSSFLPATDGGTVLVEVRTPPSSSLEYARLKVEAAARAGPRRCPRRRRPTATSTRAAAASTSTSARAPKRRRTAVQRSRSSCARHTARLVGAEYVVLDDLNNGAQKPVQIRFTGPDSRQLTGT